MGVKSHYDAISKAYLPLGDSVTTFAHREFLVMGHYFDAKIAATHFILHLFVCANAHEL